jgi:ribosomal protein L37AE/L43A
MRYEQIERDNMSLKHKCDDCRKVVIPRRIKGFYIGSNDIIKIWECPKCDYLWQ